MFSSTIQHLDEEAIDDEVGIVKKFQMELKNRGAVLQEVMPLAMRNLAISQQRDKERFRHVRGEGYDRPKAKFAVGQFVVVKQKKKHTLQPSVRPHILRIVDMKPTRVVVLQGSDGSTVDHQVTQLTHCSVPIADTQIYPHKFIRTDAVHCQGCGSRRDAALMLLCDICNKGFHTFCLDPPLQEVPDVKWQCETHQMTL